MWVRMTRLPSGRRTAGVAAMISRSTVPTGGCRGGGVTQHPGGVLCLLLGAEAVGLLSLLQCL
jgi:hypothetical protein